MSHYSENGCSKYYYILARVLYTIMHLVNAPAVAGDAVIIIVERKKKRPAMLRKYTFLNSDK